MAEDPKDPDPKDPEDPKDPPEDPPEDPEPDDKPKDPEPDPEVIKAQKRRDAALTRAQKAEEEVKALREKYEKAEEDPEKRANRKLITAEARVVLTEAGVSKDDQAKVMKYLALDDISVGQDGTVDSDTITDRVEELRGVFGKAAKDKPRTPRVDTRDRGGERAKPESAAARRRAEMLGHR